MSSEVSIEARNLSKAYRIYDRPHDRLLQMVTLGRVRRFREFNALSDVSLTVHRGETVGIVGRNGSGKSTLLQILCGTLQPSAGTLRVNGRLSALLELGAGFDPRFSGRENVYLNGAILGLSHDEMSERFDSIAAFAGIGDFIDQPVRTYSSGMYVRLAFATAVSVDPDVLVVDEALAVGDEAFQRKCVARIEKIQDNGGTILFVSHSAQQVVQLCNRAVLIEDGEKLLDGDPKTVTGAYQRLVNAEGARLPVLRAAIRDGSFVEAIPEPARVDDQTSNHHAEADTSETSWFDPGLITHSAIAYEERGARISEVSIYDPSGRIVNVLQAGRTYIIGYSVDFLADAERLSFGTLIKTIDGVMLGGCSTIQAPSEIPTCAKSGSRLDIRLAFECWLNAGTYFLNAGVQSSNGDEIFYSHRVLDAVMFRVEQRQQTIATAAVDFRFSARLERP